MFMTDVNDVKIYNLSAGKSLPEVCITIYYEFILLIQQFVFNHFPLLSFTLRILNTVANRSETTKIAEQICRFEKTHRINTRF